MPTPTTPTINSNAFRFCAWNNKGADLIQRGRYAEAIDCFSSALVNIQAQIKAAKSTPPSLIPRPDISSIAEHICIASPSASFESSNDISGSSGRGATESDTENCENDTTKPLHEHEAEQQKNQAAIRASLNEANSSNSNGVETDRIDGNANGDFLYRQPVRFAPALDELDQSLTTAVLRPLSVLVIVNTAIAHHFMAIAEDKTKGQSMKRAIVLYEMALQTQSQQLCMQPLGMNGFQLLLACYNNLGHAQRRFSARRADMCFESLLSLLMWSVVHKAVPAVSIDSYWTSVGHLVSADPAPAAAA